MSVVHQARNRFSQNLYKKIHPWGAGGGGRGVGGICISQISEWMGQWLLPHFRSNLDLHPVAYDGFADTYLNYFSALRWLFSHQRVRMAPGCAVFNAQRYLCARLCFVCFAVLCWDLHCFACVALLSGAALGLHRRPHLWGVMLAIYTRALLCYACFALLGLLCNLGSPTR